MKTKLTTTMLTLAMWCAMTTAMAQTYQVPVSEAHEQMLAGKYEPTWQSLETHQTKSTSMPPLWVGPRMAVWSSSRWPRAIPTSRNRLKASICWATAN